MDCSTWESIVGKVFGPIRNLEGRLLIERSLKFKRNLDNTREDMENSPPKLERNRQDPKVVGFGTFGGVFTPCTLTILGVIMFLRFGMVVGNTGLLMALLILFCAKVITVLTTLSLSAITTNTKIKGGGAYYLISRSLGVEFGGAIGIVFFLAQAISVAMYVIGFAEAFAATTGGGIPTVLVALVTNLVVFVCVYIGAGWTIKVQYFILATLVGSLISFFVGGVDAFSWAQLSENLGSDFAEGESLFTMFALFFPAVTGIMAGANMSGDLKTPGKSIPSGTLWSILATAIVYAAMAFFLAGTRSSADLNSNNLIVSDVSRWPILITAGIFAATLSSALGSMMGAPRILQALARDTIFPSLSLFGKTDGKSNEPRRATILTFAVSTICILLADLNTIAPLITMAFMITYGTINLATFYESVSKNPSYRPTFRYNHWISSLAGAVGCIGVMFLINSVWATVSILMMAVIYFFIYRKQVESRWGDLNSGLIFERTRKNMLKLEKMLYHPKNWRPIILAMSGGGWSRPDLAILGHWLTSGSGILSLGQVILGDVEDRIDRVTNQERILERFIRDEKLEAFPNIVASPTVLEGTEYLVQCSGMGALRPNTVLLGWVDDVAKVHPLVATIRVISALQRNLIIANFDEHDDDPRDAPRGTVDVWWRGHQNGELMLLLAHLLTQHSKWRNRKIRLMRIVDDELAKKDVINHLNGLAEQARIKVTTEVYVSKNPHHMIAKQSKKAAIVFLGFEVPAAGNEEKFYRQMELFSERLPRTVFVNSVGNMKLES